jgi:hypothetical protein
MTQPVDCAVSKLKSRRLDAAHLTSRKCWDEGARPARIPSLIISWCQVIHYRLDESFVTSQIHVLRHCCEASRRFKKRNNTTSKVIQRCIHTLVFWRHSLIR